MKGYVEHADFSFDRENDETFLLKPLTLRAVEWLRANCENYDTQATPDGFVAPVIVIFEDRVERVLARIRAANLGVR